MLQIKLITALTILLFISGQTSAARLAIGDKAPDFTVKTISGKTKKLSDFIGKKPVYLKFWATWCNYCLAEMPHFNQVYTQHGNAIEVLAVNVGMNDSVEKINKLFRDNHYKVPVIFDTKGDLVSAYEVIGTPNHVLIDKEGRIQYRTFLMNDQLDEALHTYINTNTQSH